MIDLPPQLGKFLYREVKIAGKESTSFLLADLSHVRIKRARHTLVWNRHCIVLMLGKQFLNRRYLPKPHSGPE